jgi:hypothetical protein
MFFQLSKKEQALFALCARVDVDLSTVEAYIRQHALDGVEITRVALKLLDQYQFEIDDYVWKNEKAPRPEELISTNWGALFDLFLRCGLQPNLVLQDDEYRESWNVMEKFLLVANGDIAPRVMRMMMERGGDPNLEISGEELFEKLDFDIWFDMVEMQEMMWKFDIKFKCWLVLISYGGGGSDEYRPLDMQNGYRVEDLRMFENFDYELDFSGKTRALRIVCKESGEVAAITRW